MVNTVSKEVEMSYQNAFWIMLQQLKFDLNFYHIHFTKCVKTTRALKYITAAVTSAAALIWMQWSNVKPVTSICTILILLCQILSVISDLLPHEKRKNEIREMTNELDLVYINMESDWRGIVNGEFTLEEIKNKLDTYTKKQYEITKHYLNDDSLSQSNAIIQKAELETQTYFNNLI